MSYDNNSDKVYWNKLIKLGNQQISLKLVQYQDYETKVQIQMQILDEFDEPGKYNSRFGIEELDLLMKALIEARLELYKHIMYNSNDICNIIKRNYLK